MTVAEFQLADACSRAAKPGSRICSFTCSVRFHVSLRNGFTPPPPAPREPEPAAPPPAFAWNRCDALDPSASIHSAEIIGFPSLPISMVSPSKTRTCPSTSRRAPRARGDEAGPTSLSDSAATRYHPRRFPARTGQTRQTFGGRPCCSTIVPLAPRRARPGGNS